MQASTHYLQLDDLLAARHWEQADRETERIMLAIAQREEEEWLTEEDMGNFPCEHLHCIDQLWLKHSHGKFGFTVQKRIYQNVGGTGNYIPEIWRAFGDRIGWRRQGKWLYSSEIIYDITAPEGQFPFISTINFNFGVGVRCGILLGWDTLFSRLSVCNL